MHKIETLLRIATFWQLKSLSPFSLCGNIPPSEFVLLCYPDYTHCSIFVLLWLFIIKRLRHRWPWSWDSTALQTKPPINPLERGRHESRLTLQSRPHWSRHSGCLETSIKHPKLLMCVWSKGWTQGEECVFFCLCCIINPENKMKMWWERVKPLLDSQGCQLSSLSLKRHWTVWSSLHSKNVKSWLQSAVPTGNAKFLSVCWEAKSCLKVPRLLQEELVTGLAKVWPVHGFKVLKDIHEFQLRNSVARK